MLRLATICYSQFWTTMWWNNSFPSCHIGFITTHNQWTTWHVTLKHFRNSWVELVVHETDRHVGYLMPEDVDLNESYLKFISQVAKDGLALPADGKICALCTQLRTNPAVVATSGFVFCYTCIFHYVDQVLNLFLLLCTLFLIVGFRRYCSRDLWKMLDSWIRDNVGLIWSVFLMECV